MTTQGADDRTGRRTARAVIAAHTGDPAVLSVQQTPVLAPGPGEVLLRVLAAGVGPWDLKRRSGYFAANDDAFGLGAEVCARVAALGEGVDRLAAGDRVWAYSTFTPGGYAEFATCPAGDVGLAPQGLTAAEVASAPVAALTAAQMADALGLSAGQTILVVGAAGGMGSMAVQLAKALGARVIGTAAAEALDFVGALGADEAFDFRGDWSAQVRAVAPDGVDCAMDNVGGPVAEAVIAAVRDGGRVGRMVPGSSEAGAAERSVTVVPFATAPDGAQLTALAERFDNGQLEARVQATFPLEHAADAHRELEAGGVRGKLVLVVDTQAPA